MDEMALANAVPGNEQTPIERAQRTASALAENVETVVHGKHDEIKLVLCALVSQGHVLLEDVPGTAKTVLARTIAHSITDASTSRIQCTPDLQPTDVTGLGIFNSQSREFEFRPGPVFANVVLIDEINRAMPKTQSSLLEAMAENQVTVDGETRKLPRPFLVLATENPLEHAGTFPLPEAQLDRFFLRTALGYPRPEHELRIVQEQLHGHPLDRLEAVVTLDQVAELQQTVEEIYIDAAIQRWIVALVNATRESARTEAGSSVRGTLALERAVRAWALLSGRAHVEPDDVEQLFGPVITHRVMFKPGVAADLPPEVELWQECLEKAPKPSVNGQRLALASENVEATATGAARVPTRIWSTGRGEHATA
jgi:MoxR-like ATPase